MRETTFLGFVLHVSISENATDRFFLLKRDIFCSKIIVFRIKINIFILHEYSFDEITFVFLKVIPLRSDDFHFVHQNQVPPHVCTFRK